MKTLLKQLLVIGSFLLLVIPAKSQKPIPIPARINTPIDIAILNLRIDSITHYDCKENRIYFTFNVRNKFPHTAARFNVKLSVQDVVEVPIIKSPAAISPDCGSEIACFHINRGATLEFKAYAVIKDSWIMLGSPTIKFEGNACACDGDIRFTEARQNRFDNSLSTIANFSTVPLASEIERHYCVCDISTELMDVSNAFVIKGNLKTVGMPLTPAYFAITNNLRLALSETDVFPMRFKHAGYTTQHIPLYNIIWPQGNQYLTSSYSNDAFGDAFFSNPTGADDQKWIIRSYTDNNNRKRISIFKYNRVSGTCMVLGRPISDPPTESNPLLKIYGPYDDLHPYFDFELLKLYTADPNPNIN